MVILFQASGQESKYLQAMSSTDNAPPAERNLLGVIRKVGLDSGKAVLACRSRNHHVIEMLGGRGIHPVAGLPGGWSKAVTEEERVEIERAAIENIEFVRRFCWAWAGSSRWMR